MKSITKIIIGLAGIAAIGLLSYYLVTKEKNIGVIEIDISNPDQNTVATVQVIQDTIPDRIEKALNLDGEEFKLTKDEGIYINSTKDKLLVIKEDIWNNIIRKIQKELPEIPADCDQKYIIPDLSEYNFVGLLTYLADSRNTKITSAYTAIEIRNGNAKSFGGGGICCDCEGVEPLVPQQVDAVIVR